MTLHWSPRYVLRVPALDDAHEHLVTQVAALAVPGREPLPAFRALADAMDAHFADEERFMAELGYPERQAHADEHRRFSATLARHLRHLERGAPLDPGVFEFVGMWLQGHILGADKRYADFGRRSHARALFVTPLPPGTGLR